MNPAGRITPHLVVDQVYNALFESIVSGTRRPGERLRIRDIAAELGVSATPVRQALTTLATNGLVETIPHRGAVVRKTTPDELLAAYDVRLLVEVAAARAGAARATDEHVALMREEFARMQTAIREQRVEDSLAMDEQILRTLYRASGNQVLLQHIESLWLTCKHYKLLGARRAVEVGTAERLWAYQEQLVEAADARDADSAARLSEQSLREASARVRAHIEEGLLDPQ